LSAPKLFRKEEVDGKVVVEVSGKAFGKAKDVAFGLDGTVALIVLTNDNSEAQITMDRVMGVGDYIVIRRDAPQPKPAPAPVKRPAAAPAVVPVMAAPSPVPPAPAVAMANVCRSCGASLRPGAKLCTKCGTPT
jgi:sporulation protein YlmC with PRC-barrel domain